jgi:RNA polymerase sigma-70 factor (ECF subfamily)
MSSDWSVEFPTTIWRLIRDAKDRESPEHLAAMNRFVAAYWKPVFYFIRAKGHAVDRAADLAQEFFLQMLGQDWLSRADRRRGRFRTFLLTILSRFLSDQGPSRLPKQKLFDQRLVSISALVGERDRRFEPADEETPEDLFMRQWARAVMSNVRRSLERFCHDKGRPDWYAIFCAIHFPAAGERRATQDALAKILRLTRDQVRYGLEAVNCRFAELLRAEVAGLVGSEEDVEAEIRELEALLAR